MRSDVPISQTGCLIRDNENRILVMAFKKYKNDNPMCRYPFDDCRLGYCWGWASHVDALAGKGVKTFFTFECFGCEYWDPDNYQVSSG